MLEFTVLASGSSGNALYIRTDRVQVLLDAGISGRQLQQRMRAAAGAEWAGLDAVLLTHEHVDHVRGLRQVLRSCTAPVYATEGTWHEVAAADSAAAEESGRVHRVRAGEGFSIGDLRVIPFAVSHDAEEPVAYRFDTDGASLAVVTDLGYMSDGIKSVIQGCDAYVLEANHDVEMLRAGRYPWSVKRRILGDKGHLSNDDAAFALLDVLADRRVDVYLAHLSEENNLPELAELTVSSALGEMGVDCLERVRLHRTSRREATRLHRLGCGDMEYDGRDHNKESERANG
ncbi:MBL fold metallo-hydrolase [Alicyclobacillus kakegawensis]|uniref:MBL fold metallo-hydrolase n=1 Tax=Alicyclobacillus kakegawensis TaxID=392012 RepID=UPI000ADC229E|nr:MBL fold metallo-hydrolase [Alicyclobacillus kakegawensis]